MKERTIRTIAGLGIVSALTIGITTNLRAECYSPEWDPNEIVCESCSETNCCYTHWHGDELISKWCIVFPE